MAEVKKPPSFNHTSSSSYKHIYDDIFASPRKSKEQSSIFIDDDYAEMFGSTRSNNGTWSISYSSIPVLDLPPPSEMKVRGASGTTTVSGERGGSVDYSGVFGGVGDGNIGLPDGGEMFERFNKKSKSFSKAIPRSKVKTTEATTPDILRQSQKGRSLENVFSQSINSSQEFEPKKKKIAKKNSGEISKETQTRDFPEVTNKMEEPVFAQSTFSGKIPVTKDGTQLGNDIHPTKKQEMHDGYISMDFGANVQSVNYQFPKESAVSASDSAGKAHDTSQSAIGSINAFSQPSDSAEQSAHIDSKMSNTLTSEAVCATDADVIHGSISALHEIDPTQRSNETSVVKDDMETKVDEVGAAGNQGNHSRNTSEAVRATDSHVIHKSISALREIDPTQLSNETSVIEDDTETKMDDVTAAGKQGKHSRNASEAVRATEAYEIRESISALHEIDPTQLSNETSVTEDDTETKMDDVSAAGKQGKHSRNTSSELDAKKDNTELHAGSQDTRQPNSEAGMSKTVVGDDVAISFDVKRKKGRHSRITSLDLGGHKHSYEQDGQRQRNPRFGGSQSFDASHDPHARVKVQPSMMAPSSSVPQFFPVESHYKISENSTWRNFGANVYKGAAAVSSPSLDEQLDMNSDAGVSVAALQRAIEEAAMIIQMAKEYLDREGRGSSNVRFKDTLKVTVAKDELLADEMDEFEQSMPHVNICLPADTNKRKLPFLKDTLKVKVAKDKQLADEVNKFQQTMTREIFPPADSNKDILSHSERMSVLDNAQPSSVSEDPKKVFKDVPVLRDLKKFNQDEGRLEESVMHDDSTEVVVGKNRLSLSERTSSSENGQTSLISEDAEKFVKDDPIFQHGTKFVQDGGFIEEKKPDMSKLNDERDRQEGGGEWEAAKHLNQLICGVKNKIASFMAWQTDTEKKEDPMETETCTRSQLQSEESEEGRLDLREVENTEMETAEKNQENTGCLEEHVEMEIGFLSETVEHYENRSFWNNTAEQEKAESSVDLNTVVAASALANFMFSPFRNGVHSSANTNEDGNTVSEEFNEIESMNVREDVVNEMKYEQLQGKCEEQNREAFDDTCITQDSVEEADQYRHVDSNVEETNEIMEELYTVDVKDKFEPTDKENFNKSVDEECRRDAIHDSHRPEITTDRVADDGKCVEHAVTKKTVIEQHDAQILDGTHGCPEIESDQSQPGNIEEAAGQMLRQNDFMTDDTLPDQVRKTEIVTEEASFSDKAVSVETESSCIEVIAEEMAEETSFTAEAEDGPKEHIEDIAEQVAQQAACFATDDDHCQQTKNVCLSEAERPCGNDDSSASIEEAVSSDEMAEEASFVTKAEDEHTKIENVHNEDTIEQVAEQAACFATIEDDCQQTGNVCLSETEGPCGNDHSSVEIEETVSSDEESDRTMEVPCPSDPESIKEETVLFYDSFTELDGNGITENPDDKETLQFEDSVLHSTQSDVYPEKVEIDANIMESEFHDILENRTKHLHDIKETPNVEEVNTSSGQEVNKNGVDAVQRRRRWFDNGVKVGPVERPSILEGGITEMESDHEALDESVQTGSVEIHADELDSDNPEVVYSKDPVPAVNQDSGSVNSESTPKRRRWSVKIGEEGLPVPPPLFQGFNVNLEEPQHTVNETLLHSKSEGSLDKLNAKSVESVNATEPGVAVNGGKDKNGVEAAPRRKRWFGSGETVGLASQLRNNDDVGINVGIDQESEVKGNAKNQKHDSMPDAPETEVETGKVEPVSDRHLDEANKKEKERIAVERAIREARERAFAEAKERAKRDASERSNVDARQKVAAGAQERVGKVPFEARVSSDKTSMDAKLRAERAAVERATSEARERALQKALSEKASQKSREQAGRFPAEKNTSWDPSFQNSSSSSRVDSSNKGEKYDGFDSVSAQKHKERLERRSRTAERPANVLEEKNQRDLLVQKEQAAKNMMADSLDAEVKRWSSGKEGNLRLLLSTLQYILSPESGWQAVSLTDLMESTAVRKAYKKATLCVHPDKLQQRGATIEQKYICERVFDLLKDAWSKLNPDER